MIPWIVAGAAVVVLGLWLSPFDARRGEPGPRSLAAPSTQDRVRWLPVLPDAGNDRTSPAEPLGDIEAVAARVGTEALTVIVSWCGGRPASGVGVRLLSWESASPLIAVARGVTDDAGLAVLETGGAEALTCVVDAGPAVVVPFAEPGQPRAVSITLPCDPVVHGRVIDENGVPIRGARVWISDDQAFTDGAFVGESDGEGRFEISGGTLSRYVAVWAPDHRISARYGLRETSFEDPLVIVAARSSGALRLRFSPAATDHAVDLEVGPPTGWPRVRCPDGTERFGPPPIRSRARLTDEISFRGLPVGRTLVTVRSAGFATWRGGVDIREQATTDLEISLEKECVLTGRVDDEHGAPVEGAVIRNGPFGDSLTSHARSDERGEFELHGLRAGRHDFTAAHRDHGADTTALVLPPGGSASWSPHLAGASSLRGRVVDSFGHPFPGMIVQASANGERSSFLGSVLTETDGTFEITVIGDADELFLLAVAESGDVLASAGPGLGSKSTEVVVEVPAMGSVRGAVLGAIDAALTLSFLDGGETVRRSALSPGVFDVPLPAGAYTLTLAAAGTRLLVIENLEVSSGRVTELESFDLTEITGELSVTVTPRAPLTPNVLDAVRVTAVRDDASGSVLEIDIGSDRQSRRVRWPAGVYRLRVTGPTVGAAAESVTVLPASAARVELWVAEGREIRCTVTGAGLTSGTTADIRLSDERGNLLWRGGVVVSPTGAVVLTHRLRSGTYRVEARGPDAVVGRGEFVVGDGDATIDLRLLEF